MYKEIVVYFKSKYCRSYKCRFGVSKSYFIKMTGRFSRLVLLIYCEIYLSAARGITMSMNTVTSQVESFKTQTPKADKPTEFQDTSKSDCIHTSIDVNKIKTVDVSTLYTIDNKDKSRKDAGRLEDCSAIKLNPYIGPQKVQQDFNGNSPPHILNIHCEVDFLNKDAFKSGGNTLNSIYSISPTSVPSTSSGCKSNVRLPDPNETKSSLLSLTSRSPIYIKPPNNALLDSSPIPQSALILPLTVTSATFLKLQPPKLNHIPQSPHKVPTASMSINFSPISQIYSQKFNNYNSFVPSPKALPKPNIPLCVQTTQEFQTSFKSSAIPYTTASQNIYSPSLTYSELIPYYSNQCPKPKVSKLEILWTLRESCVEFNKKLIENYKPGHLSNGQDHSFVSYDQTISSQASLNNHQTSTTSLSSNYEPSSPNSMSPGFTSSLTAKLFPSDDIYEEPMMPNSINKTFDDDTTCSENIFVKQELPINNNEIPIISSTIIESPITFSDSEDLDTSLLNPFHSLNSLDSISNVYANTGVSSSLQSDDVYSSSFLSTFDDETFKRSSETEQTSTVDMYPYINSVETDIFTSLEEPDLNALLLSDQIILSCKNTAEKLLELLALVESLNKIDEREWDTLHTIISMLSVLK